MEKMLLVLISVTSSLIVVAIIFAVIFAHWIKTRKRNSQTLTQTSPNADLSSVVVDEETLFDPSMIHISMSELRKATRNFATDRIIGDGGFGLVYKARLSTGVIVAVKKLEKDAFQGYREFRAEIEILGKLRHFNLVKILGYCASGEDRILIYEFIEKGSLDEWLHNISPEDDGVDLPGTSMSMSLEIRRPLSWQTRIKIMKGVAKGLSFLHNLDTPVIHRDIKASNVLLDSQFEAHIADFGLARQIQGSLSHVSTQFAGTMGYMPPEYKEGLTIATVKADVYSFGVLMIEIATGKRPNLPMKMEDCKEITFIEWAMKMISQGRQLEMIDPSVSKDELRETKVREFLRIGCFCVNEKSKARPSMREVVTLLNQM